MYMRFNARCDDMIIIEMGSRDPIHDTFKV